MPSPGLCRLWRVCRLPLTACTSSACLPSLTMLHLPQKEHRSVLLLEKVNGFTIYRFGSLMTEGLSHAVFSRLGGVSIGPLASLNVGRNVGDDPDTLAENHARIYEQLGVDPESVTSAQQVHGNHIEVVRMQDSGKLFANTDGLVTRSPGIPLMLRFADCQPIILYDPEQQALGLAHAGWRGVALGIALRTVEAMQSVFGTRPSILMAGLGPAIGPCCYEVGQDTATAMSYALPDWRQVLRPQGEGWRLDLPAANEQQLRAAGVELIEQAALCTSCHKSQFFSHRAEGGLTGRFAVLAFLEHGSEDRGSGDAFVPHKALDTQESSSPMSLSPPGFPTFQESLRGTH